MMKKFALILATGSLLAGGAVLAQPGGDRPQRGPMTRDAVIQHVDSRFDRMDANGDGVLNQDDRAAHMAQRFAMMDADKDGVLTEAEFIAAHEARAEKRKERREARAERRGGERMGRHGHRGGMRGMMMLKRADKDGDGQVTKAEMRAAALAHFDKADADGDGTVTVEERRAAHQAMRAQRRGN